MQEFGSVPFDRVNGPTVTLELRADDSIIKSLEFNKYRSNAERAVRQFLPTNRDETLAVKTTWGETLTAKYGDYLVGPVNKPNEFWVVQKDIFEKTYQHIRDGIAVKCALTELVPLTTLTGNPDTIVIVHTLEGAVKARSGDFFLARGIKGEIWPYPKEKAAKELTLVH